MSLKSTALSFISLLNRPFPEKDNPKTYVRNISLIGLFVTLFLYFIRPFNINQIERSILLYSIAFGLITILAGCLFELLMRKVLKFTSSGESFTLFSWILQTSGLILFIGIANFLFIHYLFDTSVMAFWYTIRATFIVGVFPTIFIGTLSMLAAEKKNESLAQKLNSVTERKEKLETEIRLLHGIRMDKIYFIESLQNYINISYEHEGSLQIKTERATLKSIQENISNSVLQKCHRSYIVNKSKITHVSGNAQGLKLSIENSDKIVPVSRSFIPQFRVDIHP